MIAWSISVALKSACFDRIIVSTDDPEIASIASSHGAEVPFLRPSELADDYCGTPEVISHAIDFLGDQINPQDDVCCVYATAPFIVPTDLTKAYEVLAESNPLTFVYAATSFPFPIQRAIRINSQGYSSSIDPVSVSKRSQDLEEAYHDAGQFYLAASNTWKKGINIFDNGRPLLLPRWRVQDIDTQEDWSRAEVIHTLLNEELINV